MRRCAITRDNPRAGGESAGAVSPRDFSRLGLERPSGALPDVSAAAGGMAVAWLDGGAIRILMGREVAQ